MSRNNIWQEIELEVRAGKKKHPNWPDHVAAQAGIVCEESGELMQACLQFKYERAKDKAEQQIQKDQIKKEAIHTAAVAIRFLENLKL